MPDGGLRHTVTANLNRLKPALLVEFVPIKIMLLDKDLKDMKWEYLQSSFLAFSNQINPEKDNLKEDSSVPIEKNVTLFGGQTRKYSNSESKACYNYRKGGHVVRLRRNKGTSNNFSTLAPKIILKIIIEILPILKVKIKISHIVEILIERIILKMGHLFVIAILIVSKVEDRGAHSN